MARRQAWLLYGLATAVDGQAFCNGRLPQPLVTGTWDDPPNSFVPNRGCWYRTWDATAIQNCMAGSWLVLLGGSNMMALHIQLQQMVGIDTTNALLSQIKDGAFGIADTVVENGAHAYFETTTAVDIKDRSVKADAVAFLKQAPAPGTGMRITVFRSNLWSEVDLALDLLECQAGSWSEAPLSIMTEIGSWYTYCIEWQEGFCPYGHLKIPTSKDIANAAAKADMVRNLKRMNTLCSPDSRGGPHGCTILSPHYMDKNNIYKSMTLEALGSCNSKHLRFVDLYDFTEQIKSTHMQRGHQDPVSSTWLFNIFFSGACATTVPANGATLTFSGDLCSAKDFQCSGDAAASACPSLAALCPDFLNTCEGWCPKETCQHALPCTYSVSCDSWDCNPTAELSEIVAEMPVQCTDLHDNWCAADRWVAVDGGINRGCRRNDGNDNPQEGEDTFVVHLADSLSECQDLCKADPDCMAIEYGSTSAHVIRNTRCEVWRADVKASGSANGYQCHKYYRPTACEAARDCNGHGTTGDMDSSDGCTCSCTSGFSGDDCSTVNNPRACDASTDCSSHGTTSDDDNSDGCTCSCTESYTGDNCGTAPDDESLTGVVPVGNDDEDGANTTTQAQDADGAAHVPVSLLGMLGFSAVTC